MRIGTGSRGARWAPGAVAGTVDEAGRAPSPPRVWEPARGGVAAGAPAVRSCVRPPPPPANEAATTTAMTPTISAASAVARRRRTARARAARRAIRSDCSTSARLGVQGGVDELVGARILRPGHRADGPGAKLSEGSLGGGVQGPERL